jgi:hypothetical protein
LKVVDEARKAGFDFSAITDAGQGEPKEFNKAMHGLRNKTWAQQLERHLNDNPDSRVLVFAGA